MNTPRPDSRTHDRSESRGSKALRARIVVTAAVVSLTWNPISVVAEDSSSTADSALFSGDYQAAIDFYDQLVSPTAASIYNHGVALYRSNQIGPAAEKFRQVLAASDDELAARARFNLGNTFYASALAQIQEAPTTSGSSEESTEKVLQDLRSAVSQYRSALRIDATDTDARANIELAQRLIDQIEKEQQDQQQQDQQQQDQQQQDQQQQDQQQQDQQQQDQQQQDQQQQDQQQQDQQQQDQQQQDQQQQDQQQQDQQQQDQQQQDQQQQDQQQQDQQQQDQQQQDQQQQDQQQQDQQQQDQQQQDQQQQDQQQQDQQQQDQQQQDQQQQDQQQQDQQQQDQQQQDQQQQDQQQQDQQQQDQQQQDQQQQDQQQQDQQQMPTQTRDKEIDAGEPEVADDPAAQPPAEETPQGELRAANAQEDGTPEDMDQAIGMELSDRMTEEEARKMLQAIRDRDMLRRLRRQAAERSRRVPVARDW